MQSMNSKITGNTLTAAEWNQPMTELQNCITKAGLALSAGNLNQLGIAIARAAGGGSYFMNAAGTADAIELDLVLTAMVLPTAYFRGMHIEWVAVDTNTTNVTITITPIASVKKLLMPDYSEIPAGLIVEDVKYEAWYDDTADGATGAFILVALTTAVSTATNYIPPAFFNGFVFANDATATANGITVTAGTCKDSSNTYDMFLNSSLGKKIDATWAAGGVPNACVGGLADGVSLTNSTWYYMHAIMKADGSVDAGFDTSITADNLINDPAVISNGFLYYRRIGAFYYNVAEFKNFNNVGNQFLFASPERIYNGAATTSASLTTTIAPPNQVAILTGSTKENTILFTAPSSTDFSPSSDVYTIKMYNSGGDADYFPFGYLQIQTDGSSRIRHRSTGTKTLEIMSAGYIDYR